MEEVREERRPWWLYVNLLGLEAPLIAVVWLFLFAQTWRVLYHPWEAYVALGFAVWAVRMTVRLVSGAMGEGGVELGGERGECYGSRCGRPLWCLLW